MDRYIGLDVHAQSTAVAIVSPTGKRLRQCVVETSASALIEVLKSIEGKRRLILEEGTQSAWLAEVLRPHVAELVVTMPKKATGRNKSDFADAFARAEELRRDAIDTPIFKPSTMMSLRDALRLYSAFTKDTTRAKNRFKALLRSRGVVGLGSGIYDPEPEELEKLLASVPPSIALNAEAILEQIYMLENLRSRASDVMVEEAKRSPDFRRLMTLPGIGEVRAATLLAVVVTPHRFRQSHQFWSYCGLGIRTEASAQYARSGQKFVRLREPLTRGLKPGHPMLKALFKGAVDSLIRTQQPLGLHYRHLVEKEGMKENLARLTLARKLAAICLAVWKSKEDYDPTKHTAMK